MVTLNQTHTIDSGNPPLGFTPSHAEPDGCDYCAM